MYIPVENCINSRDWIWRPRKLTIWDNVVPINIPFFVLKTLVTSVLSKLRSFSRNKPNLTTDLPAMKKKSRFPLFGVNL